MMERHQVRMQKFREVFRLIDEYNSIKVALLHKKIAEKKCPKGISPLFLIILTIRVVFDQLHYVIKNNTQF